MSNILIADSGATKTDWCLLKENGEKMAFNTAGMNPLLQTKAETLEIVNNDLKIPQNLQVDNIYFYGAGINADAGIKKIKEALTNRFSSAKIKISNDLLAAARATCGQEKGVVCILGTGSNSGYYDGHTIKYKNPSLGFIIGDEGSGSYLGKRILQYYFYRTFDEELHEAFEQEYKLELSEVLNQIYQKPFANRYLGSFVPFLKDHRGHYMVENILEDSFAEFHQRHILKYRQSWQYPIHFCGSVAFGFHDVIENIHQQYGLETGKITKTPLAGLADYHLTCGITTDEI